MAESGGYGSISAQPTATTNVNKVVGIASALVVVNVLLMLALSYTPVAELGAALFSNFFVGIAVFLVTVGGGYWLAGKGTGSGSLPLAGAGVALIQTGYGLFGAALLLFAPSALRAPALGITAVITGLITAAAAVVVFKTDHDFSRWRMYSYVCFGGGFVIGAVAYFVAPAFVVVAGVCFFLGFLADLVYEIWAVKTDQYASDLLNAVGIYVAVMGVFIHILQLVLRVLGELE
ncbi:hypothetical protein ACFQL1_04860 [Halomicroarcula sp. GCM10025709]|uniref:hypothetical protein n=1 Tax=Haloarcula TaxID=2237 RepID=UPI0024C281F7|nr:hypothetical protein [Halomicroarcula sp. YJ-61-S]